VHQRTYRQEQQAANLDVGVLLVAVIEFDMGIGFISFYNFVDLVCHWFSVEALHIVEVEGASGIFTMESKIPLL
jgi:hypothetical protein